MRRTDDRITDLAEDAQRPVERFSNVGYTLRGHQYTDESGRHTLETIVPGLYPGRTRHIHVKVQAPGQRVLTSQLYFPGEPLNARDGIFDQRLLMSIQEVEDSRLATFNLVMSAS